MSQSTLLSRYFDKRYKEEMIILLEPLGFRTYKKAFYRVINDVAQFLTMSRFSPDRRGIGFAVIAIANPARRISEQFDIRLEGENNIRLFVQDTERFWNLEIYSSGGEKQIDGVVSEIADIVREHVVPLYKETESCLTARPRMAELTGFFGQVAGWKSINNDMWMCMKNGEYSLVIELLEERLAGLAGFEERVASRARYEVDKNEKDRLSPINKMLIEQGFMKPVEPITYEEAYKKIWKAWIRQYEIQEKAVRILKETDRSAIQEMIKEAEEKNREFLKYPSRGFDWEYPEPWKYFWRGEGN